MSISDVAVEARARITKPPKAMRTPDRRNCFINVGSPVGRFNFRMNRAHLHTQRDQLSADVGALKMGAARMSQLLAEEALSGEDWERAVRVLAECRAERTRLGRRLIHLDATVALMWDCDL